MSQKSACSSRTIIYLHEFWKLLLVSLLNVRTFTSCTCKKHCKVRNSLPNGALLLLSKVLKISTCGAPLKPSDRHGNNQGQENTRKAHVTRHTQPARPLLPLPARSVRPRGHVFQVTCVSERALPHRTLAAEAARLCK